MRWFSAAFVFLLTACVGFASERLPAGVWFDEEDAPVVVNSELGGRSFVELKWQGEIYFYPPLTGKYINWWGLTVYVFDFTVRQPECVLTYELFNVLMPPEYYGLSCYAWADRNPENYLGLKIYMTEKEHRNWKNGTEYQDCDWASQVWYRWTEKNQGYNTATLNFIRRHEYCGY